MSWLQFLLVLNSFLPSLCCPYNCIICLNVVVVCNKNNEEQHLSGKYTIGTINSGAFVNADFITLIDFSSNSIDEIENEAFEGLDSLLEFDLSENQIGILQNGVFDHLPALEEIDLSANSIHTLEPNAFNGLKNLKRLYLSNNQLSVLPDSVFSPLTSLEILDLSSNNIEDLNINAFIGCGNLTNLMLSSNSLTNLSKSDVDILLSELPSLQYLSISDNKWHCDCNITNVIHLINSLDVLDQSSVTCTLPDTLHNMPLTDLDFNAEPLSCFEAMPSPTPSPSPFFFESPSPTPYPPSPSPSAVESDVVLSPSPSIMTTLPTPSLSSSLLPSYTTLYPSTTTSTYFITTSSFKTTATSTASFKITTLSISPSSTSFSTTSHSRSTVFIEPTPSCLSTVAETTIGVTEWKDTLIEITAGYPCPFGPLGNTAYRVCLSTPGNTAVWGTIQAGSCFTASNYLQTLISQGVTEGNALSVSILLLTLPFNHLTQNDISLLVDLSYSVTSVAGSNINILVNVFASIDLALEGSKGDQLSQQSSILLQDAVNSALFKIVSFGKQEVIIDLTNFFLGGKDIEHLDRVNAIAILDGNNAGLQFVKNGSEVPSKDIEVQYDKEGANDVHVIQVTIYTDNTLYTQGCVEGIVECNGEVVSPVAVVNTNEGSIGSVNVTFDVSENETGLCAVWNGSSNAGQGEWEVSLCQTVILPQEKVLCECQSIGAIALIQIHNDSVCTDCNSSVELELSLSVRISFSIASGISIMLNIAVIVASSIVCYRNEFVRNIQALINQALAQSLLFALLAVSLQNYYVYEMCLGLGALVHYAITVTFMWFVFRPIILLLSLIRRNLYERDCFILPFVFMAWAIPVIPISVYGVLTFTSTNVMDDIGNSCWFESFIFPNYFVYMTTALLGITVMCILVILGIMRCSGYTVDGSGYVQLLEIFVETLVFCGVVATYFTASIEKTDMLYLISAGAILLFGVYFFGANALARAKIRNALLCKKETYFKEIPFRGVSIGTPPKNSISSINTNTTFLVKSPSHAATPVSGGGGKGGGHKKLRSNTPVSTDLMMDYINDSMHQQYRYPFNMWDQVKDGRRAVRRPKGSFLSEYTTLGGDQRSSEA